MDELAHQLQEAIAQAQINHDLILNERMAQHKEELDSIRQHAELLHQEKLNLFKEEARQEHMTLMSVAEAEHNREKEDLLKQIKMLKDCIPKNKAATYGAAHLNVSDEATESQWKGDTNAYMAFLTSTLFDPTDPFSEYCCQSRPKSGPRPSTNPKCLGCTKSTEYMDKMDAELLWYYEFVLDSALRVKKILRTEAEKSGRLDEYLSCALDQIGGKDSLDLLIEIMDERDEARSDATSAKSSNRKLKEQMHEYIDFAEAKRERDAAREELQELKDNYQKWKNGEAIASNVLQKVKIDLLEQKADGIAIRAEKVKVEKELYAAKSKIQKLESSITVAGHKVTSPENATKASHEEVKKRQDAEQEKTDQETHRIHTNVSVGQAQLAMFYFVATLAAFSLAGAFVLDAAPGISSAARFLGSSIASLAVKAAPHAELLCSKNNVCRDLVFGG